LVGKPERKRSLGGPRHRLEDNIGMDHREIGWEAVKWLHLVQYRIQWWSYVSTVMSL